jgi:hypothetical protein
MPPSSHPRPLHAKPRVDAHVGFVRRVDVLRVYTHKIGPR